MLRRRQQEFERKKEENSIKRRKSRMDTRRSNATRRKVAAVFRLNAIMDDPFHRRRSRSHTIFFLFSRFNFSAFFFVRRCSNDHDGCYGCCCCCYCCCWSLIPVFQFIIQVSVNSKLHAWVRSLLMILFCFVSFGIPHRHHHHHHHIRDTYWNVRMRFSVHKQHKMHRPEWIVHPILVDTRWWLMEWGMCKWNDQCHTCCAAAAAAYIFFQIEFNLIFLLELLLQQSWARECECAYVTHKRFSFLPQFTYCCVAVVHA